ncbi:MAG: hypothetical protein ACRDZ9_04875 [Acidimicrobiales bacterium]
MSDVSPNPPDELPAFAPHNVVATYPSVEAARRAVTSLERHGVEAGDISLLGPGVEEAGGPETNEEQRAADMATTGEVGRRAAAGLVGGGAAGAAAGALAALAAFAIPGVGPVVGGGVLVAAAGGAAFGAAAGGFYAGASGLPVSQAWSHTFEAVKGGRTCVGVHSRHAGHVERATAALRRTGPLRLVRFGPEGQLDEVV